jgi:hypothetical protein
MRDGRTSWTAVLDAIRLGPADDATAVTATQLREVVARLLQAGQWKPGDQDILIVMDAGYDVTRLAYVLSRSGGGRRLAEDLDLQLVPSLMGLVEPDERGDPMSPLRWTTKSLRNLAEELTSRGSQAHPTVAHSSSPTTIRPPARP